ncbi:hypothetical protein ACT7C7_29535 [Bacillus cereus]
MVEAGVVNDHRGTSLEESEQMESLKIMIVIRGVITILRTLAPGTCLVIQL